MSTELKALGIRTDADKILAHLSGQVEVSLSPKEMELLNRVITLKSLLLKYKRSEKAISVFMETEGVSRATAYRDMGLLNQIFGNLLNVSRDVKRAIAEMMIQEDRKLAKKEKDSAALTRSTANYIKLHALDKEDSDLPDMSKFEQHTLLVAILPEQVGVNPPSDDELLNRLSEFWTSQAEEAQVVDE